MNDSKEQSGILRREEKLHALHLRFPGRGCGSQICENLCADAFSAAVSLRMNPETVIRETILRNVAPENRCTPASANGGKSDTPGVCRFGFIPDSAEKRLPPAKDSLRLAGEPPRAEGPEKWHLFKLAQGGCSKCRACAGKCYSDSDFSDEKKMNADGFWLQKDHVYRPHPNCKCSWKEVAKPPVAEEMVLNPGKTYSLNFHVRGSRLLPSVFPSREFYGIENLLKQLEIFPPHSIENLLIINHSGHPGIFPATNSQRDIGFQDLVNPIHRGELLRLKRALAPGANIEFRMCETIAGKFGRESAQNLADKLNCTVTAYEGKVTEFSTKITTVRERDFALPYPAESTKFYPRKK